MARLFTRQQNIDYLAEKAAQGAWRPVKPIEQYKPAQLSRRAGVMRQLDARGIQPSPGVFNRLSRGHDVTPEHPGRRAYEPTGLRGERIVARRSPVTAAGRRVKRPRIHRRPGIPRKVLLPEKAVVYTVPTAREAITIVRDAARDGARVTIEGYDCQLNQWGRVFENARTNWGTPWIGMSAGEVLRQWKDSGMTFEAFILSQTESSISEPIYGNIGLGHICLYQVNVYLSPVKNPAPQRTA